MEKRVNKNRLILAEQLLKINDKNSIYRRGLELEAGLVLFMEKNYPDAEEWLKLAEKKDSKEAAYLLSKLYYYGCLNNKDNFREAETYLQKLIFENDGEVFEMLGNMFLHGKGIEQDFKMAEEYFRKALENGNKNVEYIVNIFDKLNNKKIKIVKSIAECLDGIEDDIGAVLITSDINIDFKGQTLYDIERFKRILKIIKRQLRTIDKINPERTNEVEVFNQIGRYIAKTTSYDQAAVDSDSDEYIKRDYISRCLYGAVIEGKAVCVGIIEEFRNFCICKGIECIVILTDTHAYCQVKLEGEWYYFDLTNTRDYINKGSLPENFLYSEAEFLKKFPECVPLKSQFTYPSNQSYKDKKRTQEMTKRYLQQGTSDANKFYNAVIGLSCGGGDVKSAENYLKRSFRSVKQPDQK